jgi:DNA adenine methylase
MKIQTPFRYPGAKNKLLPIIEEQLIDLGINNQHNFVDAFIGGGSVLLKIAEKYPNIKLFGNDKDYWIASFWQIVSNDDNYKLIELLKLMNQPATLEHFYKLREKPPVTDIEAAYHAIFFNRTTFSGIFYSGPIGGKDQKSKYTVDCRWNLEKLKYKILKCHELLKGRTTVENVDFEKYSILTSTDYLTYLDPPYFIKGDALYIEKMTKIDHIALAEILNKRKNWLLSYDDDSYIRNLYKEHNIIDLKARYCINGNKSSWEHKNELLISW